MDSNFPNENSEIHGTELYQKEMTQPQKSPMKLNAMSGGFMYENVNHGQYFPMQPQIPGVTSPPLQIPNIAKQSPQRFTTPPPPYPTTQSLPLHLRPMPNLKNISPNPPDANKHWPRHNQPYNKDNRGLIPVNPMYAPNQTMHPGTSYSNNWSNHVPQASGNVMRPSQTSQSQFSTAFGPETGDSFAQESSLMSRDQSSNYIRKMADMAATLPKLAPHISQQTNQGGYFAVENSAQIIWARHEYIRRLTILQAQNMDQAELNAKVAVWNNFSGRPTSQEVLTYSNRQEDIFPSSVRPSVYEATMLAPQSLAQQETSEYSSGKPTPLQVAAYSPIITTGQEAYSPVRNTGQKDVAPSSLKPPSYEAAILSSQVLAQQESGLYSSGRPTSQLAAYSPIRTTGKETYSSVRNNGQEDISPSSVRPPRYESAILSLQRQAQQTSSAYSSGRPSPQQVAAYSPVRTTGQEDISPSSVRPLVYETAMLSSQKLAQQEGAVHSPIQSTGDTTTTPSSCTTAQHEVSELSSIRVTDQKASVHTSVRPNQQEDLNCPTVTQTGREAAVLESIPQDKAATTQDTAIKQNFAAFARPDQQDDAHISTRKLLKEAAALASFRPTVKTAPIPNLKPISRKAKISSASPPSQESSTLSLIRPTEQKAASFSQVRETFQETAVTSTRPITQEVNTFSSEKTSSQEVSLPLVVRQETTVTSSLSARDTLQIAGLSSARATAQEIAALRKQSTALSSVRPKFTTNPSMELTQQETAAIAPGRSSLKVKSFARVTPDKMQSNIHAQHNQGFDYYNQNVQGNLPASMSLDVLNRGNFAVPPRPPVPFKNTSRDPRLKGVLKRSVKQTRLPSMPSLYSSGQKEIRERIRPQYNQNSTLPKTSVQDNIDLNVPKKQMEDMITKQNTSVSEANLQETNETQQFPEIQRNVIQNIQTEQRTEYVNYENEDTYIKSAYAIQTDTNMDQTDEQASTETSSVSIKLSTTDDVLEEIQLCEDKDTDESNNNPSNNRDAFEISSHDNPNQDFEISDETKKENMEKEILDGFKCLWGQLSIKISAMHNTIGELDDMFAKSVENTDSLRKMFNN